MRGRFGIPLPSALCAFATVWSLVAAGPFIGSVQAERPDGELSKIEFNRDIRPILAANCFKCHGPADRKGGLRLDRRDSALAELDSGMFAIVPGVIGRSALVERVTADEFERMPPVESGNRLSDEQIAKLRKWIEAGAPWEEHWAYVSPVRPALPQVQDASWPRNAIDYFVMARLNREEFTPSPPADAARLIRRVYLDLIGLPPTIEQVDAFLNDRRPDAYERLVDELLASPHYGERWARPWLDLARYSDSNGYQSDALRESWPYRDWVIAAINHDLPFDQFTIDQIAGDLLPESTIDQRVATGFHRCTTINLEAGVDQEKVRTEVVIDRVNTTGTVWLGTTIQCAQCHDHKYDPITQEDYYRLFAFFNSTEMETVGQAVAGRKFIGPRMELPLLAAQRQERDRLQKSGDELEAELEKLADEFGPGQPDWERRQLADEETLADLPENIRTILNLSPDNRNPFQKKVLKDYFLEQHPPIRERRHKLAELKEQADALTHTTLVMVEHDEPRTTRILNRGNFLDKGVPVQPGVPAVLHPLADDAPRNRLGLARWLVDPNNPLASRVTVNRWWAEFFGQGLVATPEDFGTQGNEPTNPQLLDWLATEFIRRGWSMKAMHRLIVTSATYRQSSDVRPELFKRDPQNRLYGRGPRFRLVAETIRDNALAVSGLLSEKMGGPPVSPPQPPGIWRVLSVNKIEYRPSQGEDRFRRGVYVIWRRSSPYPSFVNFDAPDRATCVAKRTRTNTPIQALTLLNDPVYVETAWSLAKRILCDHPNMTVAERVIYAFRLCLSRPPEPEEAEYLEDVFRNELARFESHSDAASNLIADRSTPAFADTNELAAWFYVASILLNLDETITKG